MAFRPAINLFCNVTDIVGVAQWPLDDGWQGTDYRWRITVTVNAQMHGSVETPNWQMYDGTDVKTGMWIGHVTTGAICKIVNIVSQIPDQIVVEIEDIDRANILSDPLQSGFGGVPTGLAFIFATNENGEPVWGNIAYSNSFLTGNYAFFSDLAAKFRYRNDVQTYIEVTQTGHSFNVGDPIQLSASGQYLLAIANSVNNAEKVVGIVSSIGVPSPDSFSFRPLGKYVTGLNLVGKGLLGDVLYLDDVQPGALTSTKPENARPIYIKLSDTTAISIYGGDGSYLSINIDNYTEQAITEAINVGSGSGHVYAGKNDTELRFKSIAQGAGISVSETLDTVTITNTKKERQIVEDYIAKTNLNAYRIVAMDETEEKITYANPFLSTHVDRIVGLTTAPITMNAHGEVLEFGTVQDINWTWSTNELIYLGIDGQMTQTVPTSGHLVVVAKPISPSKVLFEPQPPIWLDPIN